MVEQTNIQGGDPTDQAAAAAAHNAGAAAKFQAQAAVPAATPATPELIGGKFKSQDDLLAAYKSLEAKLGAPKETPAPSPAPAVTEPVKAPEALAIEPAKAAEAAGFKLADLSAEYVTHGDLTPETRASLEKAGFGKDVVDSYIAGQKVLIEAETAAVMTKAGVTAESFKAMSAWAGANVSPDDLAAYNQAAAGSSAMKQFALEAMHTRFIRAQGQDPSLFTGQRGTPTANDVFRSTEQMLRAMADPRYMKDSAYREDVAAKVARSKLS